MYLYKLINDRTGETMYINDSCYYPEGAHIRTACDGFWDMWLVKYCWEEIKRNDVQN